MIDTPKQIITVLAIAFLAPFVIALLVLQFMAGMRSVDKDSPAMSYEAVAKRLKPVGELAFANGAEAGLKEPAAPAVAKTAATPAAGKAIYDSACVACHGTGVAGAPKAGDKAAWAPRLKTGKDTLYGAALKGKGAMPPKGGNMALADADVKAAVDYLMGLSK
jgi:cytochrome c5